MEDVIGTVIATICFVAVMGLLMTLPIYLLWNWLMPDIFSLTTITFWQAVGISMLSSCLFQSSSSSSSKS